MREAGALFTQFELSSSIYDGTFLLVDGATLYETNECVTVDEAADIAQIEPILGSGNRLPFYDELIPAGTTPPSPTDSSFRYRFDNVQMKVDRNVLFAIQVTEPSSSPYYLAYSTFSSIATTTTTLPVGSLVTIYLSFVPIGAATCDTVYMNVNVLIPDFPGYASTDCPSIVIENVEIEEDKEYYVTGNIVNLLGP